MRLRRKEDNRSQDGGEIFTLEREDEFDVGPSRERELVRKPLVVPFEALPAKTVVSTW